MEETLLNHLRWINRRLAVATGIVLLVCAAIVLLDIVLRQLGASLGGTDEIAGYAMAIATSWGMAYTLLELGHVRIDVLRSRAQGLMRSVFDLFSMLMLASSVSLIALQCWPVLARSLKHSSKANTPLETPLAWVQAPWFAGWVWFAVVAWLVLVVALVMVFKGEFGRAEAVVGCESEQEKLS